LNPWPPACKAGALPTELHPHILHLEKKIFRLLPSWLLRKEVIQPQVPLRLPCYDFTPIINPTLGACLPLARVSPATSGEVDFRGVTGGVYKARERIHRAMADARLLAIPRSCRRVAACNPN
jgi:hypothetical protein